MTEFTESEIRGALARQIGARLRDARRRRTPPLTLKAVAGDRLSIAMLSRLERGGVLPSVDTLVYLAGRLGLEPSTLLDPHPRRLAASRSSLIQAESFLWIGRDESALNVYQEALAAAEDPLAGYGAARALVGLDRLDEAESLLINLPTDLPGRAEAVGDLALARGKLAFAIEAFSRALAESASSQVGHHEAWMALNRIHTAALLFRLGRAQERGENRETAARTYHTALGSLTGLTRPDSFASALLDFARAGDATIDPRTVVSALVRATRLAAEIWVALARVELALGRRKEALAALESAIAPARAEAMAFTAVAEILGAPSGVRANAGEANDTGAATALALLAATYREAGQLSDAEEAFRQAARIEVASGRTSRATTWLIDTAVMWLTAGDRERSLRVMLETRHLLDRTDVKEQVYEPGQTG